MLEEIWSLAKSEAFFMPSPRVEKVARHSRDGWGVFGLCVRAFAFPNKQKKFTYISLCKTQRNLRDFFALLRSKIFENARCNITVLWGGCFVRRLYRSPYNSRAGRINCAESAHSAPAAPQLPSFSPKTLPQLVWITVMYSAELILDK